MRLSFRNRIALYYLIATAILVALVFIAVYFVTERSIYSNIDADLSFEAVKHSGDIVLSENIIVFKSKDEWEAREHREAEVSPVFVQIVNSSGKLMDKSPNLKEDSLSLRQDIQHATHFNTFLRDKFIRQIQLPIEYDNERIGFILAAMSLEDSLQILNQLRNLLLLSFPLILALLFFATRILAGKSIRPIVDITDTADKITLHNLKQRIPLPVNRDEIHSLSQSINWLLERLSDALEREKQFTSDASHELRTPLTILKGTLEVLVRKPRSTAEYNESIGKAIEEINRLTLIVDQLLVLARVEEREMQTHPQEVNLLLLIDEIIQRHAAQLRAKQLKINMDNTTDIVLQTDQYLLELILRNLISNAIKYSRKNGQIDIRLQVKNLHYECIISDNGIGIKQADIKHIFNPFFRSDALEHKEITGSGLGLAIVKKAGRRLSADIHIDSTPNKGTVAIIRFPTTPTPSDHTKI